ncbi:MAG: hypothetical protein LBS55_09625 [Prevotellaceae bacterium]|jgi:uncharacterized membrane protein YqhA|nr:hypothetical protein [Prevotellaceae bacterium]
MIRKLLIYSFLQLIIILNAYGQQDYKVIYEAIKNMKDYEAFQTLFNYQAATTSKDYANANGYYQLGLISQKMMRQYDPFLQADNVAQCISNAKTYLSLAKYYLDAKEVKKNEAYYQAVTAPRTLENIKKDIETRTADVLEYKKYFDQNQDYLIKGIHRYNACIETFGKINAQNSRLNDLYFLADNGLKKNLKDLQANFDSTLYYLDKLKHSLEEHSMGDYKISYSLLPVPVYRLHGLTSSNFLAKNVTLWDFKSWVDSFNAVLNADVAFLYQKAEEVHKENLGYIEKLSRLDKTNIAPNYTINPLIINKIYKYDYNSVVAPLLIYQEEKIKCLYYNADNVVDARLNSPNNYAKSNTFYYDLIAKKQIVDSALSLTLSKTNPEAIKKYSAFFEKNYKDFAGFQTYLKNESTANDLALQSVLDTYKNNVLKPVNAGVIQYKNTNLHTAIVPVDKTGEAGYFIHAKSVTSDNKVFVTGSYVNNSETQAFAALLSDSEHVEWLRTFDKKEGKNHGVLIDHSDYNFTVVVSVNNNNEISNYLYLLDINGNEKKNVKLASTSVPHKLIYDDINETFFVALKGNSYSPYDISNDALHLHLLNSSLTTVWNSTLQFTGYLSNVIRTNNQLYIYGAYSEVKDAAGKVFATDNNKINLFVYTIDASANQVSLKTFDAPFSYYPLFVSKISNEYVDVISAKNKLELSDAERSSYYLIISSDNKVSYKSE